MTNPWHQYVKSGSKGIDIIDESDNPPSLRHISDYSDTADECYNAH